MIPFFSALKLLEGIWDSRRKEYRKSEIPTFGGDNMDQKIQKDDDDDSRVNLSVSIYIFITLRFSFIVHIHSHRNSRQFELILILCASADRWEKNTNELVLTQITLRLWIPSKLNTDFIRPLNSPPNRPAN